MAASARGELTHRRRRAPDDRGDLVEGELEDVMEEECGPLGRRESFEHDEERRRDRFVKRRVLADLLDDRLREPLADVALTASTSAAKGIEREPADDGGEPGAQILDLVGVGPSQAEPGVLDHVLGFPEAAENAVGDPGQVRAQGLELGGEVSHGQSSIARHGLRRGRRRRYGGRCCAGPSSAPKRRSSRPWRACQAPVVAWRPHLQGDR